MTLAELTVERRQFITELVLAKDRAGRLGLWKTMHALDEATNAAGWELASLLPGKETEKSQADEIDENETEDDTNTDANGNDNEEITPDLLPTIQNRLT